MRRKSSAANKNAFQFATPDVARRDLDRKALYSAAALPSELTGSPCGRTQLPSKGRGLYGNAFRQRGGVSRCKSERGLPTSSFEKQLEDLPKRDYR